MIVKLVPSKADWFSPIGLLILGFIPVTAGIFRVVKLSFGASITEENARFFAAPLPVVVHLLCSILFCTLGAVQFSADLRRKQLHLHRLFGHMLVFIGLIVALSGLWMTLHCPRATVNFDGPILYVMRLCVGLGMCLFLGLGWIAARRHNIANHRAWMMRAYALGLGAGTQVFTHIPLLVVPNLWSETSRAVCMAASWGINIAVAEWILRCNQLRKASVSLSAKH